SAILKLLLGPDKNLLAELAECGPEYRGDHFKVAVAWANDHGVQLITPVVQSNRLGLEALVGLNERRTTVEGLLRLLQLGTVNVFYKHERQTFHPKMYWLHRQPGQSSTLIVGSSNLTRGGLFSNVEVSLSCTATEFEHINQTWLALLESPFCHSVRSVSDVERL